MDALIRDTVFAGLTDTDFLECVAGEIKRREMAGIVYMLPLDERGVKIAFCSSAVPESMMALPVSELLRVFHAHSMCMPCERLVEPRKDGEDWSKG